MTFKMWKYLLISLLCFFGSLKAVETSFLLIRHGETEWNAMKKIQGQLDIPLSERGLKQAEKIAKFLQQDHSDINAIYSSDLARARVTAAKISEKFGLEFSQHTFLREIARGEAEGLTYTEKKEIYDEASHKLNQQYPERKERWKVSEVPGSETYEQAALRIRNILETIEDARRGEKIAVITHGALIEVFLVDIGACETNLHLPNCAVVQISYDPTAESEPFRLVQIASPLSCQ